MLLNDIGKVPYTTFNRINQHLETNYGFKISENTSDKDLTAIMEQIEGEITELKIKGDDARSSPEISKRLLILEGIQNLREYSVIQLHSPELENVINKLSDFVVETFKISGLHHTDFDKAVDRAMDEYRSSKYRFPDDMIEDRVRKEAMARIENYTGEEEFLDGPLLEDSDGDSTPGVAEDDAEMEGIDEDAEINEAGEKWFTDPETGKLDFGIPPIPSQKNLPTVKTPRPGHRIHPTTGEEMPDPFKNKPTVKTIDASRKGFVEGKNMRKQKMTEQQNLVKNLRRLLETEVSQAEVMMAAKGFAQDLQEMIEKIGRLQNEDLPPVTDQMRETHGTSAASAFQSQIYGALQSVMDALYTAKGQVDDAVSTMAETGTFGVSNDMEADTGEMPVDAGPEMDIDNVAPDQGEELPPSPEGEEAGMDEFGGAEQEEPLGRAKKMEAVKELRKKISEMKMKIEKVKKLQESRK